MFALPPQADQPAAASCPHCAIANIDNMSGAAATAREHGVSLSACVLQLLRPGGQIIVGVSVEGGECGARSVREHVREAPRFVVVGLGFERDPTRGTGSHPCCRWNFLDAE